MSDFFVISKNIHLILRAAAVFILAPILIWKGYYNKDNVLLILGLLVLLIDGYTLWKNIKLINS